MLAEAQRGEHSEHKIGAASNAAPAPVPEEPRDEQGTGHMHRGDAVRRGTDGNQVRRKV
jgi:hypothetical protein